MKFIVLLMLAVLSMAAPVETVVMDTEKELADSEQFIAEVQGDNENLYLIVFEKDDIEDHTGDLKTALDAAPQDEVLKGYDIFQDSFENEWQIKLGQIESRDLSNYKDALALVGADTDDFKMTFPVLMIVRKGTGYLASVTKYTNNGKLTGAMQTKILEVTGAQKKRVEAAAAETPAERR